MVIQIFLLWKILHNPNSTNLEHSCSLNEIQVDAKAGLQGCLWTDALLC